MPEHDKHQSDGRTENAAQPKGPGTATVKPEAYPSAGKDDAIESAGGEARTFDPAGQNPEPRQGAGDGSVEAMDKGLNGPAGDPVEGKR